MPCVIHSDVAYPTLIIDTQGKQKIFQVNTFGYSIQSRTKIIWTTAKNGGVPDTPQAMYNQFKRPSAGSVRELYYIYRKT